MIASCFPLQPPTASPCPFSALAGQAEQVSGLVPRQAFPPGATAPSSRAASRCGRKRRLAASTTRKRVARSLCVLWFVAWLVLPLLGAVWACSTAAAGQEAAAEEPIEVPLYQQDPYDLVTLDENNGNAVLKVLPLDLPGRRVPSPLPTSGKLRMRLVNKPEVEYEVGWNAVARIELFDELVLRRAGELVAQGRFEPAYDYYAYLLGHDPQLPGLKQAIDDYLFRQAEAHRQAGKHDAALAVLGELHSRNPKYPGLEDGLGSATEALVDKYLEGSDWASARRLLRSLANLVPEHPLVKRREAQLRDDAAKLLDAAKQAGADGNWGRAHRAIRRALRIWPALEEANHFAVEAQKEYPRVVVGVSSPAVRFQPADLADWAARRSSRLVWRPLTEFLGPTPEGGRYRCPVGSLAVEDLGRRLQLQIQPGIQWSSGPAELTGYEVSRQLVAMADAEDPAYLRAWSGLLRRLVVPEVYSVEVELTRPHVRPQALLQIAVPARASPSDAQSPATLGPYLWQGSDDGEATYLVNPRYFLAAASRPREIVEQRFAEGSKAIRALQDGQVDLLDRVNPWQLDQVRALPNVTVQSYSVPLVHCLVPNMNHRLLARGAFRRAVVYGINREAILGQLLDGRNEPGCRLVSGPFPPGVGRDDPIDYAYDHSIEPRAYDPRLAIALAQVALAELAAAGPEKEALEQIPEMTLAHPADEIARTASQAIAQQLQRIGIPVRLQELETVPTSGLPPGVDLLYAELAMWEPVVDARRLLGPEGLLGQPSAYMMLALQQVDDATDWATAALRLREVHRLVHMEVSVVPLWQLTDHFAYHNSLSGVGGDVVTLYQNVEQWQAGVHRLEER